MHPMYSMLYTVNLDLCDYVLFSQIQSHALLYNKQQMDSTQHLQAGDVTICFHHYSGFMAIYTLDYFRPYKGLRCINHDCLIRVFCCYKASFRICSTRGIARCRTEDGLLCWTNMEILG